MPNHKFVWPRSTNAKAVRKFLARVNTNGPIHPYRPDLGRCREWTGSRDHRGYGRVRVGRILVRASHYALEISLGRDILKLHVLHNCDNPPCCNPTHLYAGTHRDNMRDVVARGYHFQANKTHCQRGHEYSADNTIRLTCDNGRRRCRTCELQRSRKNYARKRARKHERNASTS